MTCNMTACNAKILRRIEESRQKGGFTRAKLCRDLQHRGGTLWYIAAPQLIPENVLYATDAYNVTRPVLHLHLKECEDGTLTDKVDWDGVKAGEYIEDKAFCIVKVSELRYLDDDTTMTRWEISDKEAKAPISRLINTGIVTVKPLATMEAQWEWRDGKIRRALYHDAEAEVTDGIVDEETAQDTYKLRMEKLRAFLSQSLDDILGEL